MVGHIIEPWFYTISLRNKTLSDIRNAIRINLLESHYYNPTHFLKITAAAPKCFSNQTRTPNSRIHVALLSVLLNYFPHHTIPALFAHWAFSLLPYPDRHFDHSCLIQF